MRIRVTVISAVIAVASLLTVSCSEDKIVNQVMPQGSVVLNFDNWIGAPGVTPVELGTLDLRYTTTHGVNYDISILRYVVSDIRLHMKNGDTVGMDGIHYRNEADPTTRSMTIDGLPQGTYNKISFTFGLDEYKNLRGKYASMVNFENDMAWPTGLGASLGYHYMQIEGNWDDGTNSGAFTTHTGARQCDGACGPLGDVYDAVAYHHYFRVELPIPDTAVQDQPVTININMDINGWYQDPNGDAYDSNENWPDLAMQMIMANLPEQDKLMTNGPHCFSAEVK